jgi:site-specific DNA-cytosine methylase
MIVDLCAGAGGFTEAARLANLEVTLAVDVDLDRARTYALNHGPHIVVADVNREVVAEGPAWGIVCGPPCQPFSDGAEARAKANGGAADPRNAIPGFVNYVRALRPEWFVLENVPGLKTRHRGYFSSVLAELQGLGYYVDHVVLDASRFGVPQKRRRLFVAGRRDGRYWPWPQGGKSTAWGKVLLPLLEAREPDRDGLPNWVTSRREVPDYALVGPQLSNNGDTVVFRTAGRPAYTITRSGVGENGRRFLVKLPGDRIYALNDEECALLQGFRPDYRFSSGAEIGDAVPPPLGAAVIRAVALLDFPWGSAGRCRAGSDLAKCGVAPAPGGA